MKLGPIILDLMTEELNAEEKEILKHPLVAGVILFSRNFHDPKQLSELCHTIRKSRSNPLLITVDQEGGRVQRFRKGFTQLPAMGELGKLFESNPEHALKLAEQYGWVMANELLNVGIDLSFAPVLDLDKELNTVISDRAFHKFSHVVTSLAISLMNGMHKAGMAAVGKHFPGHGSVQTDSHHDLPIDDRPLEKIRQDDLQPFIQLIQSGIDALMPAHILFPLVDDMPVVFSSFWLKKVLRKELNFSGIIISDDLTMGGADFIKGNFVEKADAALLAGCDLILICNNRAGVIDVIDNLSCDYQDTLSIIKNLQPKSDSRIHSEKA